MSCSVCEGNAWSSRGSGECTECPAHSHHVGHLSCLPNAGFHTPAGSDPREVVEPCPAGHYCSGDGRRQPCPSGTYAGDGAAACTTCGEDEWSDAASETCTRCPEHSSSPDHVRCVPDEGYYSPAGDDPRFIIDECPVGFRCAGGVAQPEVCPQGFFSQGAAGECTLC